MSLFRASSQISTFSQAQRKVTKFQKFLNVSNVILLVTSTIIIFTAVILMKFYHVEKLDFWSSYFAIVPLYKILLGVFTFLVSFFGFAISGMEKKLPIIIYATLLCIAFISQLGSIFMSLELRNVITQDAVGSADVQIDLGRYGEDPSITAKWDELHRFFHCCGGHNYMTGYQDFRNTPIGKNNSIPDSCCHEQHPGCGFNLFRESPEFIRNKVFVNGCITLLSEKLKTDVVLMMICYACVGVALALIELISIVLACAFIAQITRRERRTERSYQYTPGDRHGNIAAPGGGETVC